MPGPDWKPRKRHRAAKGDWNRIVRDLLLFYGECEAGCGRAAESGHHFVPRGSGGDDVRENCLVLCGSGTTGCHGAAEGNVVVREGGRLTPEEVKASLRDRVENGRRDVLVYALGRKGGEWLDRRYPKREGV